MHAMRFRIRDERVYPSLFALLLKKKRKGETAETRDSLISQFRQSVRLSHARRVLTDMGTALINKFNSPSSKWAAPFLFKPQSERLCFATEFSSIHDPVAALQNKMGNFLPRAQCAALAFRNDVGRF